MSNYPGMGVLISWLGGNEKTVEAIKRAIGKTITSLALMEDNYLRIGFTDGTLSLFDDGQSCCESRYMVCADKAQFDQFVGATLINLEIANAPEINDPHGETHEVQFLNVETSKGVIQCASHNEHNGYYGGFAIVARWEEPK